MKTDFRKVTVDLHGSSLSTWICSEHGDNSLPRPSCGKLCDSTIAIFNTGLESGIPDRAWEKISLLSRSGKV